MRGIEETIETLTPRWLPKIEREAQIQGSPKIPESPLQNLDMGTAR